MAELDPRMAELHAQTMARYAAGFSRTTIASLTEKNLRAFLGTALDNLEETAAMLLNMAERATPAPGAPAGFKQVPIEPTPEMLRAGAECWHISKDNAGGYWAAMLDAAPGAPAGFKLVPIRPTMGQLKAGGTAVLKTYCSRAGARPDRDNLNTADVAYRAMLDAAPGAPGQEAADERDAARWRYAVAIGDNQCMNWLDVYADWDGDGDFADAIDAAIAPPAALPAGAGEKTS